ncbi:MAG: hypothetical protein P0S96_06520 [Simkaniaceae bacterium]|nr:hypothetical protein [Candidatus Sacchlamyda saccharinae]
MQESLDHISPTLPIDYFSVTCDLHPCDWKGALKKKHTLPNFSELLYEDPFAKVLLGWHAKGLVCEVHFEKPFEECFYPQIGKGDSIELFVDTRDLKSTGFLTRFCHHFVILPKPVDEIQAIEVTTFRSDDKHELADGDQIGVKAEFGRTSFSVQIFLPTECLHGYDPMEFDRLGFAYRICGVDRDPMHFALSSNYLSIESLASKWASLQMRKK